MTNRVVLLQKLCGPFFRLSTNLSDHDDSLRVGVLDEDVEAVGEVGPVERVSADADTERLSKPDLRRLVDGLVGEGARAGHDAHTAALVDVAGHDADLALEKETEFLISWAF